MSNLQQQMFDLYKQSKKNLEGDAPDLSDTVIVALYEINKELSQESKELKKSFDEVSKRSSILAYENQLLETRVAIADGSYLSSVPVSEAH